MIPWRQAPQDRPVYMREAERDGTRYWLLGMSGWHFWLHPWGRPEDPLPIPPELAREIVDQIGPTVAEVTIDEDATRASARPRR